MNTCFRIFLLLISVIYANPQPVKAQLDLGLDTGLVDTDIHPTKVILWEPMGAEVEGLKVEVGFRLRTKNGFNIYQDKLVFLPPPGMEIVKVDAPETQTISDPLTGKDTQVYSAGEFFVHLTAPAPVLDPTMDFAIEFLGCTVSICLFPYTQQFALDVTQVTPEEPLTAAQSQTTAAEQQASSIDSSNPMDPMSQYKLAEQVQSGSLSGWWLMLVLFLGGLATNLTPCVFPMIPITLRILGRQGDSPWASASVYSLGIVLTYTALGVAAGLTGSLFGSFMGNPVVNTGFAVIFFLLGLTMLGFGNFAKLQTLGSRLGKGPASWKNTLFMGAGAGLVAAPCTGPILGGLLAYTASTEDPSQAILLFFIYSLGFALPYVFLGGAAAKASHVKVSPAIQVGVKLLFAAAMFGLAIYYLRIPLRSQFEPLAPHWWTLALTATAVGLGACIMFMIRARLDPLISKYRSVLPSIILGIGLCSWLQWATGASVEKQLKWLPTLEQGFAASAENGRPIILDGWAEWCEACKKMDITTYQDPRVIAELNQHWTIVKVDFTTMTDELEDFGARYNMMGLPVTILMPPDGNMEKGHRMTGYLSGDQLFDQLIKFREQP